MCVRMHADRGLRIRGMPRRIRSDYTRDGGCLGRRKTAAAGSATARPAYYALGALSNADQRELQELRDRNADLAKRVEHLERSVLDAEEQVWARRPIVTRANVRTPNR